MSTRILGAGPAPATQARAMMVGTRPADDASAVQSADAGAEERLIERAQHGDRAAFGQLYQRHVDDVFAYVQLRVRNVAVAEDLTQDIFMNAFRALPRFRWQGSFAPWLLRCAHNRVANHWRSVGRRPDQVDLPSEDDAERPMPELADTTDAIEAADWRLSADMIGTAIGDLTDLQQQVIALRFGAGLSLAETADIMNRTQNAIKNLQHNALAALRRRLTADQATG